MKRPTKESIKVAPTEEGVEITAEVAWKVARNPDTGHFLAVCPKLNIFLEAVDRPELFSLIAESMDCAFESAVKNNTLDGYLTGQKWKKQTDSGAASQSGDVVPPVRIEPVTMHDFQLAGCS